VCCAADMAALMVVRDCGSAAGQRGKAPAAHRRPGPDFARVRAMTEHAENRLRPRQERLEAP